MLGEDGFQFVDEDDIPDAVLSKMLPRKSNRWFFLGVFLGWIDSVLEVTAEAVNDLQTLVSQRASYEDDRSRWSEGVGYEIERVDDFLKEVSDDGCAE